MSRSGRKLIFYFGVGCCIGLFLLLAIHVANQRDTLKILGRLGSCLAMGIGFVVVLLFLKRIFTSSDPITLGSDRRSSDWISLFGNQLRRLAPWHHTSRRNLDDYHKAIGEDQGDTKTRADRVYFSVTGPKSMKPGFGYVIDVWAHLNAQRPEVIKRALETTRSSNLYIKSKGPISVPLGTLLSLHLEISNFIITNPRDTIEWNGEITNATFGVDVPPDAAAGPHLGTVRVYANGVRLLRLHFSLIVGPEELPAGEYPVRESHAKTAFASYANEDRNDVLGRVQGMLKIFPNYDIFLDVVSLRSGENWENRLEREIASREVFHLFWSEAASRSDWVEREWKIALDTVGIDAIDPVPLQSPEQVPPPRELAEHIHFNDWILAFRRNNDHTN